MRLLHERKGLSLIKIAVAGFVTDKNCCCRSGTGFVDYRRSLSGIPALEAAKAFSAIFVHIDVLLEQLQAVIKAVAVALN